MKRKNLLPSVSHKAKSRNIFPNLGKCRMLENATFFFVKIEDNFTYGKNTREHEVDAR